jgi:hypothetical protein
LCPDVLIPDPDPDEETVRGLIYNLNKKEKI